MNRTKQVLAIGLLCLGTSGLSFGETFSHLDSATWDATYNSSTALFGAVIQQDQSSLESGLPPGDGQTGAAVFGNGGDGQDFTLTYDPTSGDATLKIGSNPTLAFTTLKVAEAGGTLDHVGIALSTGAVGDTIEINGIKINGDDAGSADLTTGPALFDVAMTPPTDLTLEPFTLTGNINISWTSQAAPGAQISAEIIGADALVATPEPGTLALLGSALAGLGLLRRKRIV